VQRRLIGFAAGCLAATLAIVPAMPATTFFPLLSAIAQLGQTPGAVPWRVLLRTTGYSLRPPNPRPHPPGVTTSQQALLASGAAGLHQRADILCEERPGGLPTIVVGGFVPDATEAAYLIRTTLLRNGSVYYVNYPRRGFSTELIVAQLADLAAELADRRGRPPVVLAISFGAGIVFEWLRRSAAAGRSPALAGIVLISPVACVEDLLDPAVPKPTTLLGRAIKPYLDENVPADNCAVEKSRALFLKMFEAGAQNRTNLRQLLAPAEVRLLRDRVLGAINAIDARGAIERVRALRTFPAPVAPVPLHPAPSLILYAEKENAVLCATSPTTRELTGRPAEWFPASRSATVRNTPDNPVQHASLIFHSQCFAPRFAAFYGSLRSLRRNVA
jgi:hypothetical protein